MIANNIVVFDSDVKICDHFRTYEFSAAGDGKGLTFVDPKLMWILEAIRRQTREPLYIKQGNDGPTSLHQCGMAATVESDSVSNGTLYSIALDIVPEGHATLEAGGVTIDSNF